MRNRAYESKHRAREYTRLSVVVALQIMTKPLAAWICAATLAMVMHGACAQEPGERIAESARKTMDAAELPAVPGAFYELELTLATFLQGHWDAKAMFAAAMGQPYHIPYGGRADYEYADDVAKTNLTAILQQHGLGNVRSL